MPGILCREASSLSVYETLGKERSVYVSPLGLQAPPPAEKLQNNFARSPTGSISTGGRKANSKQGLSKYETFGGNHLGTEQRAQPHTEVLGFRKRC